MKPVSLDEVRRHSKLSPEEYEALGREARTAFARFRLRHLRTALRKTQGEVARQARFTQSLVSKLENGRVDMRVSTLERYVAAAGGRVRVLAEMPDGSLLPLTD